MKTTISNNELNNVNDDSTMNISCDGDVVVMYVSDNEKCSYNDAFSHSFNQTELKQLIEFLQSKVKQ